MDNNIVSLLWQGAEWWPDKPFLEGSRQYRFDEAKRAVMAMARSLKESGVKPGDRVIILAANRPETILALFALATLGATAVILHEQTAAPNLKHITGEVEPSLVLLGRECERQTDSFSHVTVQDLDALPLTEQSESPIRVEPGADRLAFIVYTSGSTGKPRGVMLSHDNVLFVVPAIQARLGYNCRDRIGLFIPLSFDYGLYQAFLAALSGACLVVQDSRCAGPALAATLQKKAISVLPGLPNMFESLIHLARRRPLSLEGLRLISSTGAHLARSHIQALKAIVPNAAIFPMYGLTECKRVSILTPEEYEERPQSVGRPLDGTRAWVVDESGKALPPGEEGELVVEGPHVAQGYWRSPEETARRYRVLPGTMHRVLFTGDTFRCDGKGYLYYVGRKDEQIKRHGFRINRLEIERAAIEESSVTSASLLGSGKQIILFAVSTDQKMTEQALLKRLATRLEPYKLPDQIKILEAMPLTRNGKIDSQALREQYDVSH